MKNNGNITATTIPKDMDKFVPQALIPKTTPTKP
jgi:hypothetical protein